jgi:S-adenosylmethionine:tRNA ribosyltransferase-isomerase
MKSQTTFPRQLLIKDYTYNLPEEKIANKPLTERDLSKLLIYQNSGIKEDIFKNLANYLPEKSLLIFNDTKVIQARLLFTNSNNATIEIFCLEPVAVLEIETAMIQKKICRWKCLIGNAKRFKETTLSRNINNNFTLNASKIASQPDGFIVEFTWNADITFAEVLAQTGLTPLPPYIKRTVEKNDEERYQTVYAQHKGSVAAPTAGLHISLDIINELAKKNIDTEKVTLHVGAGTFMPVKSESIGEHEMHSEEIIINKSLIEKLLDLKTDIIAVGTTSLRTLESLYWLGVKVKQQNLLKNLFLNQWEPYELESLQINKQDALQALLDYLKTNNLNQLKAKTQIIIAPGYKFKMVDALITNFHQPNSTLLLLVAAFVSEDWKKIYDYALNNNFRFLSYGDGSLLFRNNNVES